MRSNDAEAPGGLITELRTRWTPFRPMSRVMIPGNPCSCRSRCWSRCTSICRPWSTGVAARATGLRRRHPGSRCRPPPHASSGWELRECRGQAGRRGRSHIVSAQGPTRLLARTEPAGAHLGAVPTGPGVPSLVGHRGESLDAMRHGVHALAGVNHPVWRRGGVTRPASWVASW
jgi:hypothetical protein